MWTLSHHGALSNELADPAPNQAAKWHPVPLKTTSVSDLINNLKKYVFQDWIMYWKHLSENNELRHIKPMPSLWKPQMPIFRKLEIFLHRVRLGHTYYTCVLLIKYQPVLAYHHCGNPITVKHILSKCSFHTRLRQKLWFPESYEDIFLPTQLDKILKFINAINFIPFVPPGKSPTMACKLGE